MDYSRYEENHLKVEMKEQVAIVTLNRPDKRNAVNAKLHEGLEHLLSELSYDAAVGAIVITGAGKSFCAGGDLVDFYPPDHTIRNSMRNRRLNWSLLHCEAPLIAAINGTAAGLGASIALFCDVTFMSETAKIGDTHVGVGLTAGDGGQVIWPLLVGPHRAKEYLMAGEMIPASEADRIGLVNHVVPADQLMHPKADDPHGLSVERRQRRAVRGALDEDGHQQDARAATDLEPGLRPGHGVHVPAHRGHAGGHGRVPGEAATELPGTLTGDAGGGDRA